MGIKAIIHECKGVSQDSKNNLLSLLISVFTMQWNYHVLVAYNYFQITVWSFLPLFEFVFGQCSQTEQQQRSWLLDISLEKFRGQVCVFYPEFTWKPLSLSASTRTRSRRHVKVFPPTLFLRIFSNWCTYYILGFHIVFNHLLSNICS